MDPALLAIIGKCRALTEADGIELARARRAEMRNLIVTDPQRALTVTVPAAGPAPNRLGRRDAPARAASR